MTGGETAGEHLVIHDEEAMGTVVSFTVVPGDGVGTTAALSAACAEIHRLEALLSTWDPDSAVSRLRRGELVPEEAPAEVREVLDRCRQARMVSKGWFDPWVMPGGVDPTGLAKGWVVEQAVVVLQRGGVAAGLVNAGGDVAGFGRPAPEELWRVGIRHPWRDDALAGIVELDAAEDSLATSGVYERGPHLIDPRDGSPRCAVASASVRGPSLSLADALATALAVAGSELLPVIERWDAYEAYVIDPAGREQATAGFTFASPG